MPQKPTAMRNLHVSCHKFAMFLFLILAIFCSCTDDDIFTYTIDENSEVVSGESPDPLSETGFNLIAEASPINGSAPLTVTFSSDNSLEDKGITTYNWDFDDGNTATTSNTVHTFTEAGNYTTELTVLDENGQIEKDSVTIAVSSLDNEAPKAVAEANILIGDAPLTVEFTGSSSSDDGEVVDYYWDFPNNPLAIANGSYTFNNPGIYDITLTVTDDAGLVDSATLTITVLEGSGVTDEDNIACSTGGGTSGETGEKIWCWRDIEIIESSNSSSNVFSNGQLRTSSHCNTGMITNSEDRLYFKVNPTTPAAQEWCNYDYNYRAEIREHPADVDHPVGTEQWFGWDYTFEDGYAIDRNNPWLFWQIHGSFSNPSNPMVSLWIGKENMAGHNNYAGEIFVVNAAVDKNNHQYTPTGLIPVAGTNLKVVVHVIWGDDNTGLYEVWINGASVYSQQIRTVYAEQPEGGYAKWGIYKWRWQDSSNVQDSQSQGISELNTSMGTLRVITRSPGDPDYGKDSYSLVKPD